MVVEQPLTIWPKVETVAPLLFQVSHPQLAAQLQVRVLEPVDQAAWGHRGLQTFMVDVELNQT
jgi:hypothetical protein